MVESSWEGLLQLRHSAVGALAAEVAELRLSFIFLDSVLMDAFVLNKSKRCLVLNCSISRFWCPGMGRSWFKARPAGMINTRLSSCSQGGSHCSVCGNKGQY